jgi:autotransporter translocation and assembly factor TamB
MVTTWPSWRTWRRIGLGVGAALLIVLLALRLFAMTPMAHNMLESRLEAMTIRGQSIEIDGLSGDLLGRMSIETLTVKDENGIWLTGSQIDLAWRPSGLIARHLNVREVSAATVNMTRRPTMMPSTPSSGSIADRYTLNTLNLERVSLLQGVAGPSQSYSVTGALEATGARGSVQLDLSALDFIGDEVRADLTWGGDVPIAGHIDMMATPNGLLATLLGAPPETPLSFNLKSSPHQSNWQLLASGAVGDVPSLDLKIELSDERATASGEIMLDQLTLLAPLNARFGPKLSFDAEILENTDLRATAETNSFTSTLTGSLQTRAEGVIVDDFELSMRDLDAGLLTSLSALSLAEFDAKGTLSLLLGDRAFEGHITAPDFAYGRYQLRDIRSDGRLSLAAGSIGYDGQVRASQIAGLPSAAQARLTGPLTLRLDGQYLLATRELQARLFRLEGRALEAMGQGSVALNGPIDLSSDMKLKQIAPFSEIDAALTLTGPTLSTLDIEADGVAALSASGETLGTVIGDQANFSLTARRDGENYDLRSARVENERFSVSASGRLAGTSLDLSGRLLASSADLSQVTISELISDFEVDGSLSSPRINATARADTVSLSGQVFDRPEASARIAFGDALAFIVSAQSIYSGAPLTLNMSGERSDGLIDVSQLDAAWADLRASGQAALDPNAPERAAVSLDIAGTTPIGGSIDGTMRYAATQLNTDLSLVDLKLGALDMDRAHLTLDGTWPNFAGALDYDADLPLLGTPQELRGDHKIRLDANTQTLSLSGSSILAGNDFLITHPIRLSTTPDLQLSGAVSAFGGDLSVIYDATGASPAVLALSGMKMSEIGPLIDRPSLVGTLDGALTLGFEDGQLTGGGSASLINLARGMVEADETNLAFEARIEANTLTAEVRTDAAPQDLDLLASLSAPLRHENSLSSIRIAPGAPIPVSLKGRGEVAPIWALIAPTNLRVTGDVDLDIRNGDGTTWRFEGPVGFENGVFEDGFTGLHLKEIKADAQLRPDGIDVNEVFARGAGGGQVTGQGLYGFDGDGSVSMRLNGLNALRRSDISGSISGTAEIERRNRRTQINGDLEIDQARINLERLPGAGYTTLDVDFQENGADDEPTAPTREAIELRLDVSADRRIFVSGSGIDTEWGLDARVTGPPGRPNVIGRATLIRGEADLLSRRFRFSEGDIRFVGEPTDTQISIRADRVSEDVTSTISLSGTLMDPQITLSSDPTLPDDEILSRVLFGRSPSELSPLQAAQLAGAAAQLAGGDALNLVGQLQEATGLDRLDIGLDESGGATLATGKYLADDIYLEIESGVTGAPGVTLEWTPLENVAVDAEIDPELGPKLAIQWKRDFDRLPGEPKND